jgi:hypothetical protein
MQEIQFSYWMLMSFDNNFSSYSNTSFDTLDVQNMDHHELHEILIFVNIFDIAHRLDSSIEKSHLWLGDLIFVVLDLIFSQTIFP